MTLGYRSIFQCGVFLLIATTATAAAGQSKRTTRDANNQHRTKKEHPGHDKPTVNIPITPSPKGIDDVDIKKFLLDMPLSKKKRRLILNWATSGGVMIQEKKFHDFWRLLDNSFAINFYIDRFREPLSKHRIQNLKTVANKKRIVTRDAHPGEKQRVKFRAVCLLYRNGAALGEKRLAGHMKKGSPNAAKIYAMNRNTKMIPYIIKAYDKYILHDPEWNDFVPLAAWSNPNIRKFLVKKFDEISSSRSTYALLLAVAGDRSRLKEMKSRLHGPHRTDGEKYMEILRDPSWIAMKYAIALDRMRVKRETARRYLRQVITSPAMLHDGYDQIIALQQIGYCNDKKLIPALTSLIKKASSTQKGHVYPEVVSAALEAELRISGKLPIKLLPRILASQWGNISSRKFRRFQAILVASGNTAVLKFLQHPRGVTGKWAIDHTRMSKKEIQRIQKLRAMKWLPDDLLPKSSRGWDVLWSPKHVTPQ